MCGISGAINIANSSLLVKRMVEIQKHRGPDSEGVFISTDNRVSLGHNRLSIIDLSENSRQPLFSQDGNFIIVFNGELYNYKELKNDLKYEFEFRTESDTEVVLYSYIKWGATCLDKFIGMFSFAIWQKDKEELFAARDRFGVKPFHYAYNGESLLFSSEIKAIWNSESVTKSPNESIWVEYFINSKYDHTNQTFWEGILKLDAGCFLKWSKSHGLEIKRWYNLIDKIYEDTRKEEDIMDELLSLLESSVQFRFRSDVPVGICLSGGVDSSLLFALVLRLKGKGFPIHAFTFYTGNSNYDELPWVEQMIKTSSAKLHKCLLKSSEVADLAPKLSWYMDEPFGGIPTLGMKMVFEAARNQGITVLLDGNGMDEGWAGYDYYRKAKDVHLDKGPIQQSKSQIDFAKTLSPDFMSMLPKFESKRYNDSPLLNLQLRDILAAKIPRAMRFADRNSMAHSLELREPFLDHRMIELGLCQRDSLKINESEGKLLIRKLAKKLVPENIIAAPKRGVQTPQREWLSNELLSWTDEHIDTMLNGRYKHWFMKDEVKRLWQSYQNKEFDNSFFVWQWINFSLLTN